MHIRVGKLPRVTHILGASTRLAFFFEVEMSWFVRPYVNSFTPDLATLRAIEIAIFSERPVHVREAVAALTRDELVTNEP